MARRLAVLLGMLLVVALLFWAGVRNRRHRVAAMQTLPPQLSMPEADSAALPDAQGASLIGKPAPNFTLRDLAGKKVSLADFKGKPVVVNFWASWCGPCKLEMPWFQEFSQKYKGQGLVVLGLSQDDGTDAGDIAKAAQRIGVTYPILLPDSSVAKKYGGVDYLPETFYVGRDGNVVLTAAGAPSKDQMEAYIQKTIAAGGA